MTTSKQRVSIRRANPMDVVKICRLLSEDRKNHLFVEPDEGLALAFVLGLIEQGYVAVAEQSSDRIVGVIAFGPYIPGFSREAIFDCEFFVVSPAYKNTGIGLNLLRKALACADGYNAPVRVSVCNWTGDKRSERWFSALGFEPATPTWLRQKNKKEDDDGGRQQDNETDSGPESVVPASGAGRPEPGPDAVESTI